jgi:hypothetical protein
VARLQALSLGHALDLDSPGAGAVHSVFAHAVNIELRGELWTLLSAQRPDLPFGIRVASREFAGFALRSGDRVSVRSGLLGIGSGSRLVVDCRAAARWMPAAARECAPGLAQRLEVVASAATDRAWPGSASMAQRVTAAWRDAVVLRDTLSGVVGFGPGSTPAGDDVLIGLLAVLTSPRSGAGGAAAARSLTQALLPLLPTTSEISAHLLRQAARGLCSRPVHELVCALLADTDRPHLSRAAQRVVETGATSGADICIGMLAAAAAFLGGRRREAVFEPGDLREAEA